MCKLQLLTQNEKKQTLDAQKRENLKICLTGLYPSLCKQELLSEKQKKQSSKTGAKTKTSNKTVTAQRYIPKYYTTTKSYSYSVSGYDDNTNYIYGDIDVDQSGGDGYIYDDDGNSIYINVDWTGKGQLEGYDDNGKYYELEVD